MMKNVVVAVAAVMLLVIPGCRRSIEIPEDPVSYAEHVEQLILDRCVGCHRPDKAEAELKLVHGRSYDALVVPMSVQVPDLRLIAPGEPEASYVWRKLDDTASVGKGMPRSLTGYRRLPPDELELVRRWISDGALP